MIETIWYKLKRCIFLIFVLAIVSALLTIGWREKNKEDRVTYIEKTNYKEGYKDSFYDGNTYYVTAESKQDTKEKKYITISEVNNKIFQVGDRILFERGKKYYTCLEIHVSESEDGMLYIGNYGDQASALPTISGATIIPKTTIWSESEGIYSISNDELKKCRGFKNIDNNIGFFKDENGKIYGNRKATLKDLTKKYDFYCDTERIYIKDNISPSQDLGNIEVANRTSLLKLSSNTIVEGLKFENCGSNCIVKKDNVVKNVIINKCVIDGVGGVYQYGMTSENQTRFGNGIEFWDGARDVIISNNIVKNVYDAGITLQGYNKSWENVKIKNNIIIDTSYPFELFTQINADAMKEIEISGNITIEQGKGWASTCKPDNYASANFVFWGFTKPNDIDITIKNNLFIDSLRLYYDYNNSVLKKVKRKLTANNNYYYCDSETKAINEKNNIDLIKDLSLDTSSKFCVIDESDQKYIASDKINSDNFDIMWNYYNKFDQYYLNKRAANSIIEKNREIEKRYRTLEDNMSKEFDEMEITLNKIYNEDLDKNINVDLINDVYSEEINVAKNIVINYKKKNFNINDNDLGKILLEILNVTDEYKLIYEEYVTMDSIDVKQVEECINNIIYKYNQNLDINLINEANLINNIKDIYNNNINTEKISENYLNKMRILKTAEIINLMFDEDIKPKADDDYKKIKILSQLDLNTPTNQDIIVQLIKPNEKVKIISDNGAESYRFSSNGTKNIKMNIRGYEYTYTIKITNIDKTLPKVTAQNGQSLKINVVDENLKEIIIEKDGKETAVNNGQVITTPGIYKITAIDKAGNSTNETAIVYGTYTNEQNSQVKYVTIKAKTKVSDVKQDCDYTIKDNNNITAEIKRAPSPEKDSNSYIATGDILQDNSNTYIVITLGDLSSNGDVGVADLIKLRKSLVGLTKLTKIQALAADTNQNGSVNVSDLQKERKIMVGMEQ